MMSSRLLEKTSVSPSSSNPRLTIEAKFMGIVAWTEAVSNENFVGNTGS